MILQFKGINNVWCYEEAEQIRWANVWVGSETRDYREGGEKWKRIRGDHEDGLDKSGLGLKYVTEMHKAVDKLIKTETNCGDEIVYYVNSPFNQLENVCVVTLTDKNKNITYVFEDGVYLLNNRGQTVQRIA